jgi:hypothetical protein
VVVAAAEAEAPADLFQVEALVVLVEVEETMEQTPPQEEREMLHLYHHHKEIMEVIIHPCQIPVMLLVVVVLVGLVLPVGPRSPVVEVVLV